MSPVYQLTHSTTEAAAKGHRRVGRRQVTHAQVWRTHHGGVKMTLLAKGSWVPPQADSQKPPENPSAKVVPPGRRGPLRADEEQAMVEHLPIVRFIARRIHKRLPQHVSIEDLYSAGVIGLVDAFNRFDPSKEVPFRTYAQFRIRGAIFDSLRTLDWSPRELRRKGRAVQEAIRILMARTNRSPTESEIAQELHISLAAYQQLLGQLRGLEIGNFYSERSDDSGEEEPACVPTRPEDDPLFQYLEGEMRARLTKAIDDLPQRERLVMTLYYFEELTMKEVALILDVVESRVSQIHASAVLHLRAQLAMPTTLAEPAGKPKRDCLERARGGGARRRIETLLS